MEHCNGAGSDLVLAGERSAGSGGRTRRLIAKISIFPESAAMKLPARSAAPGRAELTQCLSS
jgi:hypothetical protein